MHDFFDWFEAQSYDTQVLLVVAAGVFVLLLAKLFAWLGGGDK